MKPAPASALFKLRSCKGCETLPIISYLSDQLSAQQKKCSSHRRRSDPIRSALASFPPNWSHFCPKMCL